MKATIEAEDKALEALALHIKTQGRAFSLFDAAKLVLAGEDRHHVRFECEPERLVGLFLAPAAHALFETKEEALKYLLRAPEFLSQYYQEETIELEAPKGNFTSVAVCGFTGEILGPPSHHSYQTASKRLYAERFGNMSFDDYKRRIRVDNSPEMVEKWKEQQSKGVRWVYLKGEPAPAAETPPAAEPALAAEGEEAAAEAPAEPAEAPAAAEETRETFNSRADMEAHFRRTHGDEVVREVREAVLPGNIRREQVSPGLGRLFRRNLEEARKHLFEISQKIAHGLERRGMKLFKRRAGKMFVSRVKPRAIDPGVIFSERIKSIVEVVKAEPGILASKVVEKISPSPSATEGAVEGEPKNKQFTDDQVAVLRDLRWLSDEGYVIEYSDGPVFLGVQGEPPQHGEGKAKDKGKGASSEEHAAATPEAEATSEEEEPAAQEAEAVPVESEPEAAVAEPAEVAPLESEPQAAVAESAEAAFSDEPTSAEKEAAIAMSAAEAEVEAPIVPPEAETVKLEEKPAVIEKPADEDSHPAVEAPAPLPVVKPAEEAKPEH